MHGVRARDVQGGEWHRGVCELWVRFDERGRERGGRAVSVCRGHGAEACSGLKFEKVGRLIKWYLYDFV